MTYLEIVNHPNFRESSKKIAEVRKLLSEMGLSHQQSYDWIKAWASGAGDGIA